MSEISYITDENGRRTHVILPLETYQALLDIKELLKSGSLQKDELYYLNFKDHQACGYPVGPKANPHFILTRGSEVALQGAPSLPERIMELKEKLLDSGRLQLCPERNAFVLTEDTEFKSVSQAALLASGLVINGMEAFKNKAGFSLRRSGYGRPKRSN